MENNCEAAQRAALFQEELAERLHPAFVVEESSRRLVYVNDSIRRQMGDITGQTCHKAFWNSDTPCTFCPERQETEGSYQWECFDESNSRVYKICNTWKTVENCLYRLSMATDASDIMELNRSVVDYLWLMQQLSELQVRIMDNQSRTLDIIVEFLRRHFGAERVAALRQGDAETYCLLCEADGETVILPADQPLPPADRKEVLSILNETCTFFFYGMENTTEWQENRAIILNVVKLYLENELLARRIAWENEHDRATRLRNRVSFRRDSLTDYAAIAELSVIFLDIDNLKQVNDTFGHEMGDRLIRKAADVLLALTDHQIHAYRMGGDEFVVVCAFGPERAQKLMDTISEKLNESNEQIPIPLIRMSKGLATAQAPFEVEALVREADERMYADKRARKAGRCGETGQ